MEKINRILNFVLLILLLALWGSIFIIRGIAGAVAWSLAKLYIAPIAVVFVLVSLVVLLVRLGRKKSTSRTCITLFLSILLAFPMLMLMEIVKLAYPANVDRVQPSITATWPLKETTLVGWGGNTIETNRPHVLWASERWAYDLMIEPAVTGSQALEDYGIYNKEVVAPVSGTVIAAYDDEEDILPNSEEFLSLGGNYIYIKIDATGTYLLLYHLRNGSVLVEAGDHVNEGEVIARVGNSGTTSEPHLHIQHQRQDPTRLIHMTFAEGLPLYFKDIDGNPMPERGSVITPTN